MMYGSNKYKRGDSFDVTGGLTIEQWLREGKPYQIDSKFVSDLSGIYKIIGLYNISSKDRTVVIGNIKNRRLKPSLSNIEVYAQFNVPAASSTYYTVPPSNFTFEVKRFELGEPRNVIPLSDEVTKLENLRGSYILAKDTKTNGTVDIVVNPDDGENVFTFDNQSRYDLQFSVKSPAHTHQVSHHNDSVAISNLVDTGGLALISKLVEAGGDFVWRHIPDEFIIYALETEDEEDGNNCFSVTSTPRTNDSNIPELTDAYVELGYTFARAGQQVLITNSASSRRTVLSVHELKTLTKISNITYSKKK